MALVRNTVNLDQGQANIQTIRNSSPFAYQFNRCAYKANAKVVVLFFCLTKRNLLYSSVRKSFE